MPESSEDKTERKYKNYILDIINHSKVDLIHQVTLFCNDHGAKSGALDMFKSFRDILTRHTEQPLAFRISLRVKHGVELPYITCYMPVLTYIDYYGELLQKPKRQQLTPEAKEALHKLHKLDDSFNWSHKFKTKDMMTDRTLKTLKNVRAKNLKAYFKLDRVQRISFSNKKFL